MRAPWSSGSRNRLRDGVGEYVEVMKLLLAGVATEQTQCLHSGVGRPDRHRVKMPGRQPGVDLRLGEDMQTGELLRRQAQEGAETVLHARWRQASSGEQHRFGRVDETLGRGDTVHFSG